MSSNHNNNTQHRHGGGTHGNENRNTYGYYDRFHLNQYYNAIEDEQIYMDEYTSLILRYNEFIVNANILFTRMEQTMRENLTRTQTRQSFYFHQSEEFRNARNSRRNERVDAPAAPTAPATATPATATPATATPATATPATATATAPAPDPTRLNELLPRLLSRYLTANLAREASERQPPSTPRIPQEEVNNIFSMLYTGPIAFRTNTNHTGAGSAGGGPPTNDQIIRATLNTLFSNILSPVNATCPITRDEFDDNTAITMIRGCNHIFNRESLREWFIQHSTCPLCRRDIREYQESTAPQEQGDNPANISIDSVDQNHITFSYDLPANYSYNYEDDYRHIINTITGPQTINDRRNNADADGADNDDNNDDDDMEEVD